MTIILCKVFHLMKYIHILSIEFSIIALDRPIPREFVLQITENAFNKTTYAFCKRILSHILFISRTMSINIPKDKVRCFCSKCKIGGGKTISRCTYALHSKNDIIPQSNQTNIIIQNDITIPDSTLVNKLQSNVSSEHIVSNSNSKRKDIA